ncbi:hypothetical protein TVAG_176910 [Trichomonas vaginalis G3]|uniref:Uncharacterized protein n=1 Tax=Trichomonas vaginalis (strain ATCC PRA-98 / G3) TaxID=412133 RepID=A2F9S3_TRIV3|nr:hypothetical protein TVAGG3_1057910 [Trichomonas vaginalis G3]EAX98321.1 hypothetical protein TVAG_176910 [Trichomonas vaginalis G3]KAI5494549.1 hypothetical protein TVAGG3_1057910 [Trichomonas vaginalis G3]|eukprot:XP_001311251.1 hypothetical protein [Trichomonas vaginalis G3]
MEQRFDSLNELIVALFKEEQTAILSIDKIYSLLESSTACVNVDPDGYIPANSVPRRKTMSVLQDDDTFVQVAAAGQVKWALKFKTTVSISDTAILSSIESMLTANGPMTIHQFAQNTDLPEVDAGLFLRFLTIHSSEFSALPDGTYWFAEQPLPEKHNYHAISIAVYNALQVLKQGTPDQIYWYLCLSTVENAPITNDIVLYELTHNPDVYEQPQLNVYRMMPKQFHVPNLQYKHVARRNSIPIVPNDTPFDPEAFFGKTTPFVFRISC